MAGSVYTIGYATKPLNMFINQLVSFGVTAVVDVRSVPFSKVFHEYHQPSIKSSLARQQIHYIYMGDELGPRSKKAEHYNENLQIQFDRLMRDELFLSGIKRIENGVQKGHNIALMCAEKHPLDCHRSLLLGHYLLHHKSFDLVHLFHDGSTILQSELETLMLKQQGLSNDLFLDTDQLLEKAWRCQCEEKNYIKPDA